ncbi:GMC family oxidoreductase N-terminal domain-containing protein [Ovoidimarina sediminis]|uniref:GMC family oxidoreductase N-terminal domain-containing protein n=1 Tax=Ovoidimarina sediminis TaxID=3079856 RepID=UPI00291535A1|nr:GMC family oxidoreductase N-terminal domain-containing protein [Rhodophyticola sp. MJ-SS7]MDU8944119.1 GMC family oxidoreductase N-terminal domain-containing protein [Rhodophyticola sp. MJ-SS7]
MPEKNGGPAGGYDYVVVGSGSAGSLLSSRLGASGARVLVIEAGGRDHGFRLKLPVGYFKSTYNARVSHLYRTEPGEGVAGRRIDAPRGRVLGGSSSINGLIFIRGQHPAPSQAKFL